MTTDLWNQVDAYIQERLVREDRALLEALEASEAAGLPAIAVSAAQGKMLNLLVRATRPSRILEVGTLGGYSTIWLARGLESGGRLTTLEVDPKHAEVARSNLKRAGLSSVVDIRVGPALDSLPALERERAAPFDLVFIDADKANNAIYIDWAVRLGRTGTMIIVDNVVRKGLILDASSADEMVVGSRRAYDFVSSHPALSATAIQTVGSKGHDGFLLAIMSAPARTT